jgi:hypothetical protein
MLRAAGLGGGVADTVTRSSLPRITHVTRMRRWPWLTQRGWPVFGSVPSQPGSDGYPTCGARQ